MRLGFYSADVRNLGQGVYAAHKVGASERTSKMSGSLQIEDLWGERSDCKKHPFLLCPTSFGKMRQGVWIKYNKREKERTFIWR